MGRNKKNGEPLPDLMATAQINPSEFSPQTNNDRLRSTFYALAGFVFLVTRQPSIRWLLLVTIVVLGLALLLQVTCCAGRCCCWRSAWCGPARR